ncbi:MAG: DUF4173 domain-containing protein [bacterium]
MTTPALDAPERARIRDARSGVRAVHRPLLAPAVAARAATTALIVGVAGDALLRGGPAGVGLPVWVALIALCMVSLIWTAKRTVSHEAGAWLAVAVVFACGLAWRASEMLQLFDFAASAGALAMAAIALSNRRAAIFALRLRDTLWAFRTVALQTMAGVAPLTRDLAAAGFSARWLRLERPVVRGGLIVTAVLLVFGSLLRSADPIFASLVALPSLDVPSLLGHLFLIGFFGWVFAGWARSGLAINPDARRAPDGMPFALDLFDVTTTLTSLNVLFAAFVATQLGWFFGGERFLQARTGLTVASYARQGFFQMLCVVALVVPLLVATRAALRPGRELARRHTLLSLPIVALLGAIVVSAMLRMKLYVHYYGMTPDRFYPVVVMLWLAAVLVWLAATVLRGWGRPFVAGSLVSGLVTLAALNIADPDMIVARINVDRAARLAQTGEPTLDLGFLAELTGRAVVVATRATLANSIGLDGSQLRDLDDAQRCEAATELLRRWGPTSPTRIRQTENASWRTWNADDGIALNAVAPHTAQLRSVQHATCARARHARAGRAAQR